MGEDFFHLGDEWLGKLLKAPRKAECQTFASALGEGGSHFDSAEGFIQGSGNFQ